MLTQTGGEAGHVRRDEFALASGHVTTTAAPSLPQRLLDLRCRLINVALNPVTQGDPSVAERGC
jgi:hypothetical protein